MPDSKQKEKAIQTLRDLHLCFSSWDKECCVLGNVKAGDAIEAINIALSAAHRADVFYRYDPPI